ncbi:MAG: hypothetical protein IJO56_00345 [Oscillospiraceae bacterium]|nr:hypothetical protein [Oscillospiraceae bacterium]
MKKGCFLLVLMLCLYGCSQPKDLETVSDGYVEPAPAEMRQILLTLPEEAARPVSVNETGERLYVCDGYSIMLQTLEAGDLDGTLRSVTGYSRSELTVMSQQLPHLRRYDCVWTSAGEGGDQVGRTAVLDDGSYHYCLSVMADCAEAGDLEQVWSRLFRSFTLA